MTDAFKIIFKIALHFNGHTILEQIFFLRNQFRRQVSDTLFGIRTIGRTAKIHIRIHKAMAAFVAFAAGVVLKKLNGVAALRTLGFKNCPRFPVKRILSRTFHDYFLLMR
jgi:hypothetical protein